MTHAIRRMSAAPQYVHGYRLHRRPVSVVWFGYSQDGPRNICPYCVCPHAERVRGLGLLSTGTGVSLGGDPAIRASRRA